MHHGVFAVVTLLMLIPFLLQVNGQTTEVRDRTSSWWRINPESHSQLAYGFKLDPAALTRGPAHASVTVVEFADFRCSFCAQMVPVLAQLQAAYPEDLRIVFKHRLLSVHSGAVLAHKAALAAAEQEKFWEMHDLIFATRRALRETPSADLPSK